MNKTDNKTKDKSKFSSWVEMQGYPLMDKFTQDIYNRLKRGLALTISEIYESNSQSSTKKQPP